MEQYAPYAQAGVLALAVLALLHGQVWRLQRQRWSLLLAIGYLLAASSYAFDAQLVPTVARANPLGGPIAAIALVLLTLALIDYVGLPPRVAKSARWVAVLAAAVVLVLRLTGAVPLLVASGTFAAYFVSHAVLMGWAMRREPRSGHGLVLAALLLYPAMYAAAAAGLFPPQALRYLVLVPTTVLGVTILTTGLLRAQRQAQKELARREAAEQALLTLNESLEERVTQRTEELREVVAGLESFNRSVSHDLRGPLGGIAGVSRLATEAAERGDLGTVQRLLPVVTSQAEASSQLVVALLALAKVGEIDLAPQAIDLEAFVRETLELMRVADPGAADVAVDVGALPTVRADPGLLRQLLVNLLGNALKFSRSATAPRVEIGAGADATGRPVLYVRDNGIGFDDRQAARLFEPFQRLHGAQYTGHGVGLSIVKRVAERHGGRVWAQSRPGDGATFYFTLGAAEAGTPPPEAVSRRLH